MKFTDSHEWVELESDQIAKVGVTKFAQQELGDIVYVELPGVGKEVKAGQEVAVLESTKAAADIYSPVSGEIIAINEQLKNSPEWINQFPEDTGWIYKVKLSDSLEMESLMDKDAYQALLNGA